MTLVFTDLADSTALKTQRGDAAIASLISRHTAHVKRLATDCGGRVIDWSGDGCFLTFETSSSAVLFALRLQQAHAEEADLPGVRIGIHMGEVTVSTNEDGAPRVAGLAVDLAARISGLARPGQMLMSAAVYDSARQRIGVESLGRPILWQAHGTYALKGFDKELEIGEAGVNGIAPLTAPTSGDKAMLVRRARPIQTERKRKRLVLWLPLGAIGVFGLIGVAFFLGRGHTPNAAPGTIVGTGAESAVATGAAAVPAFGDRPAIAVLPFDNFSPNADQAFFADGLAEDLITRLAAWRAFPVISRTSSFKYRGSNLDIRSVSADLGARYLVEGSVRREGGHIRVTAQLIDATTGEHVWAEKYDREIKDVFALQDEISSTIAASLVTDLNRAEGVRAKARGTENLEAWSLYQLGVQHSVRYTRQGVAEARRFFEQAIAQDPSFATAYARLAEMINWQVFVFGGVDDPGKESAVAFDAARRAVDLDPRDAAAHAALSWTYIARGDARNGLDAATRAVQLNPSMPEAWLWCGWAQLIAGDPTVALASTERARSLDPQLQSGFSPDDNLSEIYFDLERYSEGLAAARRLAAYLPEYWLAYVYIAMNAASLDRMEEARAAIEQARRIKADLSLEFVQGVYGVSRPEIDARRNAALRQAGLE